MKYKHIIKTITRGLELESYNCIRCKFDFFDLLSIAKTISKISRFETNLEFINRVYPCISDEEIVIKKLLE